MVCVGRRAAEGCGKGLSPPAHLCSSMPLESAALLGASASQKIFLPLHPSSASCLSMEVKWQPPTRATTCQLHLARELRLPGGAPPIADQTLAACLSDDHSL